MTTGAAQTVLTDRALIAVQGDEARGFLHGLLTQDIEGLAAGEVRYGALLTPQGRLRFDLFAWGEAGGVTLDVAAAARDEFIAALALYRLRAKVRIEPDHRVIEAAWHRAPEGDGWRPDPRLPALGWRRIGEAGAPAQADYGAHRVALGIADPATDGAEPLYPIEANIDLLHGIDFKKGCFIGQETTSRMKRRGQIKTRISPVTYDGAQIDAGTEILAGDLRAGRILSGVAGRSLALLRIDRAVGALTSDGRAVTLDPPPWLVDSFTVAEA